MHKAIDRSRLVLVLAMLVAVLVVAALAVRAASAGVSPSLQSGTSPYNANWSLTWGGSAPFEVLFSYGDGNGLWWPSTYSTSYNANRTFATCVDKSYFQALAIEDSTGAPANAGSRVNVNGGAFCFGR